MIGKLAFLVGLPRSGKSSIARQWRDGNLQFVSPRRQDENPRSRVIVCADDVRLAMGTRFNESIEDHVCSVKHTMIKSLLYEHDVLVDGTHTTPSSLLKLFNIDAEAEFYFVDTPPDICIERARFTNQEDLISPIHRLEHNLYKLTNTKNWTDMCKQLEQSVNNLRLFVDENYAYKPIPK